MGDGELMLACVQAYDLPHEYSSIAPDRFRSIMALVIRRGSDTTPEIKRSVALGAEHVIMTGEHWGFQSWPIRTGTGCGR